MTARSKSKPYEEIIEDLFDLLDVVVEVTEEFGEEFPYILHQWSTDREIKIIRCQCACHVSPLGLCLECCP